MGGILYREIFVTTYIFAQSFFLFELINVQTFENFIKSDLGVAYIVTCDCVL